MTQTTKFDRDSVTNEDIRSLHSDAASAGDEEMAALCEQALNGDSDAAEECIDALEETWAAAQ